MTDELFSQMEELLRETFEGARPGKGTQYLDYDSGIRNTLKNLTAEQVSRRRGAHPSIAAHARHMDFHLRVSAEWVLGDHSKRDWIASFEPQTVTAEEWTRVQQDLEAARAEFLRAMKSLPHEKFVSEGAGMGAIAHLAYHLGAIRQLLPAV